MSFNQLLVDQAQVSLNFAAFPTSSPGGERLGAGPALRLWRDVLHSLSRFWQIDLLYRANAKHQPEWVRPLHLLPILSRPTQNRDRGTQGRGLHRHPRMAPAALTSSPIDRTARNTAELDGRNTEDRTLALSGHGQRNALSIHAPQSGSTDS